MRLLQVRRVIGIWRERGVVTREHSDSLSQALDDPDAFLATAGAGGGASALLLGAALGVLGGEPPARERGSGGGTSGGGQLSARSDGSGSSNTPRGTGASAVGAPTPFYGTGFSSDFSEAAVPAGGWGASEEGGAWQSAAAAKEEAAAAAAAALQRAAAEREELEAAAAARPATPLTILEQAAAGLLEGGGVGAVSLAPAAVLVPPPPDALLVRFQEALDAIDRAESESVMAAVCCGAAQTPRPSERRRSVTLGRGCCRHALRRCLSLLPRGCARRGQRRGGGRWSERCG